MYDDRDISGLLVTPRLFGDGLPDLLLKLLGGRCRRRNLLLIKSSPEILEPGFKIVSKQLLNATPGWFLY